MPQVLTVGSESLAAGFATRNNYTRTAECNRRLTFDERAPNVPFKLGLRVRLRRNMQETAKRLVRGIELLRRVNYESAPLPAL